MSIWGDLLAALDRGRRRRPVAARLTAEPGPPVLSWPLAAFVPTTMAVSSGKVYGRAFRVRFPDGRPDGHRWGLATWPARYSGTGRPEVRACCQTCSSAAGWTVGPAGCVTAARTDPEPPPVPRAELYPGGPIVRLDDEPEQRS